MTARSPKASPSTAAPRRRKALPPAAPVALWEAFDEAMALLPADAAAPLAWCSPAFAARLALPEGGALPSLAELCGRLAGLADGLAALAGTGARGAPAPGGWDGEVRLAQGRGRPPAALHASLRRLPDGAGVPGGALALRLRPEPEHDLATRRHLEDRERLLFTSRSVAVGEMATTLAHELNQPLGAVTNVLRGLKGRLAAPPAQQGPAAMAHLAQGVQLALDQVQYAARIIGRIRDYTQSRQPRRERVDLNALLNNSLTLLDWELRRHGVQLSIDLRADTSADDGAPVAGDGVMLQQVLVNLLRNAIDAMSDTPAGQRRLAIGSRLDDAGQLEIAIADTGAGIDDGAASQLFTPFFSTKPTGMGIGLNICRSLIELHQGRLWFTSNAERGCTFHIALPLAGPDEAGRLPRFLDAEEPVS